MANNCAESVRVQLELLSGREAKLDEKSLYNLKLSGMCLTLLRQYFLMIKSGLFYTLMFDPKPIKLLDIFMDMKNILHTYS